MNRPPLRTFCLLPCAFLVAFTTLAPADPPASTLPANHPTESNAPEPQRNESREHSTRTEIPEKPIPSSQPHSDKSSTTHHALKLEGGTTLNYDATAATLPHLNDDGKPTADFFYVAYEKTPVDRNRPLTFVFNGGPGAAAIWLHLGTAGPRIISLQAPATQPAGSASADASSQPSLNPPPPPGHLIDNPDTWLLSSDLVFIDPIGTGYSRQFPDEKSREVFSTQGDTHSVAEFIRLYLTRNNRWESPKFLAGESYGTTRAAALSDYLNERHGIAVNGIVLISTVLDFATLSPGEGNDLPYILYLPSYASVAHFHHKLPPDLQSQPVEKILPDVERFALNDYTAALNKGISLSDQDRDHIAETLTRYTGLSTDYVLKNDLRIPPERFEKKLLNDQRKVIGRFDARLTAFDDDPAGDSPDVDPSLSYYLPLYATTANDYLRRVLGYQSDAAYEILSGRVHPWDFGARMGYLDVAGQLREAMIKNPTLKVFVAEGTTDLATPYLAVHYTLNRLALSPDLRQRITETHYPAGHMVYHNPAARTQLNTDIRNFIEHTAPPAH